MMDTPIFQTPDDLRIELFAATLRWVADRVTSRNPSADSLDAYLDLAQSALRHHNLLSNPTSDGLNGVDPF